MIKRTIEISNDSVHLAVELNQLKLLRHQPETGLLASVPCEDIGIVVVDHPGTTYTHAALAKLVDFGAVVVVCGRNHLPTGLLLPLADHTEVVWRIHDQVAASKPLHKRLWRQIVRAKVRNQAANLDQGSAGHQRLVSLVAEVKAGDRTNIEAQAAKVYWSEWLGDSNQFRRDTDGEDSINAMLNYGYAIVRAGVARTLISAGLHPALGIHHANRSNAFCLADDLLEPLRPFVDRRVRDLHREGQTELKRATKAVLLGLLTQTVTVGDQAGPLMVGLHRMASSLARCLSGEEKRLCLPQRLRDEG